MTAIAPLTPTQRVVAASGLSNLADGIRIVALPLVALEVTSSPLWVAAVFAASQAPWLLVSPWAGALSDRTDRIRLARRTALLRSVLLAALAALLLFDLVPIALLVAMAFVLGSSEVLADTVSGVLIPLLVPEEKLERANSRMVLAEVLGNELVGPAIGGLLFAFAAFLPFVTNAGLLGVVFLLLTGLRPFAAPEDDELVELPTDASTRGLSIIRSSPQLRTITVSTAALAAVDGTWFSLLALVVTIELELPAAALGIVLALGAVGGLVGAAVADRLSAVPLSTVASLTFAAIAGPLVVLGWLPNRFSLVVALVVTSAAFAVWNVVMVSARQRGTKASELGRVGATHRMVVMTAALVGTLVGGFIAEVTSLRLTLVVCGVATALAVPVVRRSFRVHAG